MKYTFERKFQAHLGVTRMQNLSCIVPDQVADDQQGYDGHTFPAHLLNGSKIRVRLNGDDYDLHGPGTGDMVVRRA